MKSVETLGLWTLAADREGPGPGSASRGGLSGCLERRTIMKRDYDVIVIGAGIGGLSAASLLSHAGFRTLVLEKNNFLGGRCASYRRMSIRRR